MSILENIGASVASGIVSVAIAIAGFFGYTPEHVYAPDVQEEALGADTQSYFGGQTYALAGTGISSSASTFTLTSFTITQNGKKIQDSEMADTFFGTFEPGSRSRQEFFSCTTVVQNADGTASISGCSRGLSPVTPYTASTSLQFAHGGGTSVIFSNTPQFYDQFTAKGNDETITGQWTFTTFPITASTSIASATTSGIVELATGAEAASSTLSGDITTSKLALHTAISTSSAPSSGNVVVVTGDDGNIDLGFMPDIVGSSTLRVYTNATSTWTKPSNLKHIEVWVCGSGGSGASGATNPGGGGGGGGGCAFELLTYSDLEATSSVFITVGTVAATSSSFGNFLSATGGSSGSGQDGGVGGVGSGGHLNMDGTAGAHGNNETSGGRGGTGGASHFGGGGRGGPSSGVAGSAGGGYGAGGGGGWGCGTGGCGGSASSGGAFAPGVVMIKEYF